MTKTLLAAALAALASGTAAQAQDAFHWPAPALVDGPQAKNYFPMGTQLRFTTRTEVNTKRAKPGDRIYLEVAEPLTYQGQVVVPVGSPAIAEVARSQPNGHFGRKGKLDIRLLSLQTPHGPVRLSGHASDEGKSGAVLSIATFTLVSPLGFLIRGTSGRLPFGSVVEGYLAEPLAFYRQPAAPALATVQPDQARSARFDPNVFKESGAQPGFQ